MQTNIRQYPSNIVTAEGAGDEGRTRDVHLGKKAASRRKCNRRIVTNWGFLGVRPKWSDEVWARKLAAIREVKRAISGRVSTVWVPVLIVIVFYVLLGVAVFGTQPRLQRSLSPPPPPRLFLNGETARVAGSHKLVVVMMARFVNGEWVYFCFPK